MQVTAISRPADGRVPPAMPRLRRLVVSLVCAATMLGAGVVVAPPASAADAEWLAHLNHVRTANGLRPVTVNSSWSDGIRRHLIYLAQTPESYRTGEYANAHTENPRSPYYSEAGAREAGRSNLVTGGTRSDLDAINVWLGAPFHGIGMLRPGLRQVGLYRDSRSGAAGLDILGDLDFSVASSRPIVYPAPNSVTNLTKFAPEFPDPIHTCRQTKGWDASTPAVPLIAMLPSAVRGDAVATMTSPSGRTISTSSADLCLVSAQTYRSADAVYGPTGKSILENDNAALIIARTPLSAGRWKASIGQGGMSTFSWSFTTTATQQLPASLKPSAFLDVSDLSWRRTYSEFFDQIQWMDARDISTGWSTARGREYRPTSAVTREAMAAFLWRIGGRPDVQLPSSSPFVDVDESNPFYEQIVWLSRQGITRGWTTAGGTEFRPGATITRDAMVAFLYRLAEASPVSTASPFVDITRSSTEFYDEILWAASEGITTGSRLSDGRRVFGPGDRTRRDATAAFLYRFEN